jgi:UDP-N-acetylmuramoylalanine--D-glutamate ligase
MIPITVFAGREVAVFGLGASGIVAARALLAGGARVTAWDDNPAARETAGAKEVPLADLAVADWSAFAALVLAPGIPLTYPAPHWSVKRAREAGIEIIGDVELFFRERAKQGGETAVVAITGTNGKSTTTALTAHLLAKAGREVALGGNIGCPVLELAPFADGAVYVLELSSFQIDLTPTLAPDFAALINISPDHIDRHGDLEHYAAIKARIFERLPPTGTAVIGVDDAPCRAIADRLAGAYAVKRVSVGHPVDDGCYAESGTLRETREGRDVSQVDLGGIASLRGAHNWQNAAIAYALARAQGASPEQIAEGLRNFPGLAHRMEQVGQRGKVIFVNDSKATNADAVGKALASYDDIYWIAGGRAKAGGLSGLEPFFPKIARAYLIGESAEGFASQLGPKIDNIVCGTLDRALRQAAEDASQSDAPEPVVLLSPACASYDQFRNFEERGDTFRDLVEALGRDERAAKGEGCLA